MSGKSRSCLKDNEEEMVNQHEDSSCVVACLSLTSGLHKWKQETGTCGSDFSTLILYVNFRVNALTKIGHQGDNRKPNAYIRRILVGDIKKTQLKLLCTENTSALSRPFRLALFLWFLLG